MLRWLWYFASGVFLRSQEAIGDVHVRGIMYRAVEADIGTFFILTWICVLYQCKLYNLDVLVMPWFFFSAEKYICYAEQTHAVLQKLSKNGKKMFLITNSPLDFVWVQPSY